MFLGVHTSFYFSHTLTNCLHLHKPQPCTCHRQKKKASHPLTLSSSVHCCRSSWELPELREGRVKAISDSDGVSYPWYGNTTETVTLTGPTSKPSRLTVSMNDNFYPSVTWAVPISNSNTPMLTHITRDQSFITWLVAMNSVTKVGTKNTASSVTLEMKQVVPMHRTHICLLHRQVTDCLVSTKNTGYTSFTD